MHENGIKNRSTTPFYGLSIFGGTMMDVLETVSTHLTDSREKKKDLLKIYTPNPEQFVLAWQDPVFQDILSRGDLLLPDGAGLVWAVKRKLRMESGKWKMKDPAKFSILNSQLSTLQRLAGREVFHHLLQIALKKQYKVFFLGGAKGAAETIISAYKLEATSYKLDWAFDDGPKEDEDKVLEKIKTSRPDIVFVAYGAPWQEKWVDEYQEQLVASGVRVAMVVGGAFDYESGRVSHVPLIVEKMSLEWLWRLVQEPWRCHRQLQGLQFFWTVLTKGK